MDNEVSIKRNINEKLHLTEVLFALSGVFILVSVYIVFATGDFTLWTLAKVFYGIGVLLVLKYT